MTQLTLKDAKIANDNFAVNVLTTTTASSTTSKSTTTFRPRLIYPNWNPKDMTKEPEPITGTGLSKGGRRKRSDKNGKVLTISGSRTHVDF